jgi:ribosomal protein L29
MMHTKETLAKWGVTLRNMKALADIRQLQPVKHILKNKRNIARILCDSAEDHLIHDYFEE